MKRRSKPSSQVKTTLTRFQMDITPEMLQEIEALQHGLGLATKKDLLNNALILLKWASAQRQLGYSIAAIREDGCVQREVMLPCLEHAAMLGSAVDGKHLQSVPAGKRALKQGKASDGRETAAGFIKTAR